MRYEIRFKIGFTGELDAEELGELAKQVKRSELGSRAIDGKVYIERTYEDGKEEDSSSYE